MPRNIPEEQTRLIRQFYLSFKKFYCINEAGKLLPLRLNLAGIPGPAAANRECLKNGWQSLSRNKS
jgi:hypothetical protein